MLEKLIVVLYRVFDSEIGLIEAKNIGRQVVNDENLYYMTDRDTSTMILMKQWYFHLLPYETRLTISGMSEQVHSLQPLECTGQ